MKNIFLILLVIISLNSCKNKSADNKSDKTSTGTLLTSGPEVDILKKGIESWSKGDWTANRSLFSDSALTMTNTADKSQAISIDSALALRKASRADFSVESINNPIYEVVVTPNGNKYGHIWCNATIKNIKSGKIFNNLFFVSSSINKDNKIDWEWVIFDTKPFEN